VASENCSLALYICRAEEIYRSSIMTAKMDWIWQYKAGKQKWLATQNKIIERMLVLFVYQRSSSVCDWNMQSTQQYACANHTIKLCRFFCTKNKSARDPDFARTEIQRAASWCLNVYCSNRWWHSVWGGHCDFGTGSPSLCCKRNRANQIAYVAAYTSGIFKFTILKVRLEETKGKLYSDIVNMMDSPFR
jgi:hypothetical protein